jgi:flagellar hook-associated protein 2
VVFVSFVVLINHTGTEISPAVLIQVFHLYADMLYTNGYNQQVRENTMSISVGGLISGLDTNSLIGQMLDLQKKPIENLQKQSEAYEVTLSTYGTLQGLLGKLKTAAEALQSEKDMTSFTATSGNTDLVTATAGKDARAGSYSVSVTQMARVHKLTSTGFEADETVGAGTLRLQVGDLEPMEFQINAQATIDEVAAAINESNAGVQAAVIFDGSQYFLTLAGKDTGEANVISLTVVEEGTEEGDPANTDMTGLSRLVYDPDGAANMANTQDAADAILTVDGVAGIRRSSNEITDVIAGVTLNLKSAPEAPDNATTLTVSRDRAAVVSSINGFVNAYNDVMDYIKEHQAYDPAGGAAGVLLGDATTNSIRNRLQTMITGTVSGMGSYEKLADLGVEQSDGRLSVNSTTLNRELNDRFDDVVRFFSGSSGDARGLAVSMNQALTGILDTRSGTLAARTSGIQESMKNIGDKVERLERQNLVWEERTRAQYNAMEQLLAQYQTTGDYLTQQIIGMQNLNSYVANRR